MHCKKKNEITSTNYLELYPGVICEDSREENNSLYVLDNDMIWCDYGLCKSIKMVVPSFDEFSNTVITREEWEKIGPFIEYESQLAQALYKEIDAWVNSTLIDKDCFTIIGV